MDKYFRKDVHIPKLKFWSVTNLNTKTHRNQKLLNIEFDQKFKNYNFIIEYILKFKTFRNSFTNAICDSLYLQFGHQNVFKSKNDQYKSCLEFQNLQLY